MRIKEGMQLPANLDGLLNTNLRKSCTITRTCYDNESGHHHQHQRNIALAAGANTNPVTVESAVH